MFAVLRYDPDSNGTQLTAPTDSTSFHQTGGYVPLHSACDKCRAKKLKCSGSRSSCDRCKATSDICTFSSVAERKDKRRRRTGSQNNGPCILATSEISAPHLVQETVATAPESLTPATLNKSSLSQGSPPQLEEPSGLRNSNAEDGISFDSPIMDLNDSNFFSTHVLQDLLPDFDAQNAHQYLQTPELQRQTALASMDRPIFADRTDNKERCVYEGPWQSSCKSRISEVTTMTTSPCSHAHTPLMAPADLVPSPNPRHHESSSSSMSSLDARHALSLPPYGDELPPSPHSTQNICQCAQNMVFLLEALEDHTNRINHQTLDSSLAYQKEVLGHCTMMLQCSRCSSRSDYMILLAVVCNKLVELCEKALAKVLQQVKLQIQSGDVREGHIERKIIVGDYQCDTFIEWIYLMEALIVLHVKRVSCLLDKMKTIASRGVRGPQMVILQATTQTVARIAQDLKELDLGKKLGVD